MRFNREVHTVHDPGGAWVNKIHGNPVSRHHTKENAVRRGRQIVEARGAGDRQFNIIRGD